MTDREAIRMLAKAVLTLSRLVPHTSVEGLAKTVLEELPMPAAPTDDACDPPNDRYEWMDEYDRGHADGLAAARKLNEPAARTDGKWPNNDPRSAFVAGAAWWEFTKTGATIWASDRDRAEAEAERRFWRPAAPTVTREQADRVKTALAYYFDAKDFGAMGPDWPAFFRAVADKLEGK